MSPHDNPAIEAEQGDLEDHLVPPELLELYEVLEWEIATKGGIRPPPNVVSRAPRGSTATPIITRSQWGARPSRGTSRLTAPSGSTAHYEGPQMGDFPHSSCASKVRGIQAFHMDSRGWTDIAYNSIVCPHGYIFVGRWWGVRSAANGTNAGNDAHYAHCALLGVGDAFPEACKRAMKKAFELARMDGSAGAQRKVHSDWKATACPGDPIRDWVRAGMPTSGDTPTPEPTPTVTVTRAVTLEGVDMATVATDYYTWGGQVTDPEGDGALVLPYEFGKVLDVTLNQGDHNGLKLFMGGSANEGGKHKIVYVGPPNVPGPVTFKVTHLAG